MGEIISAINTPDNLAKILCFFEGKKSSFMVEIISAINTPHNLAKILSCFEGKKTVL